MKRILFFSISLCLALHLMAQPAARRKELADKQKSRATGLTERARLTYPVQQDMPDDAMWSREVYRTLDLTKDENAALYYPVEPVNGRMNLFTLVFRLVTNNMVPAYDYRLDGNEVFTTDNKINVKELLDRYHIYYEENNGKFKIENADIPSNEVMSYFIKEVAFYDQHTGSYHKKVTAICPVLHRADEFSSAPIKYPLFWLNYKDLSTYLTRNPVMTSNLNNSATMSVDDYFSMNMYKGEVYKTTNMQNRLIMQYCETDSARIAEEKRIDQQLVDFEKNIWGQSEKPKPSVAANADAVKDSTAVAKTGEKKSVRRGRSARRSRGTSGSSTSSSSKSKSSATKSKSTKAKTSKPKSSGSSSGARASVRRQRH
ncbi:MAG: gliding motility protein GldN [Bacteroidaceae bacterium]|nr:gliding motility protein GldN [Bacteroidaceae bacterium]